MANKDQFKKICPRKRFVLFVAVSLNFVGVGYGCKKDHSSSSWNPDPKELTQCQVRGSLSNQNWPNFKTNSPDMNAWCEPSNRANIKGSVAICGTTRVVHVDFERDAVDLYYNEEGKLQALATNKPSRYCEGDVPLSLTTCILDKTWNCIEWRKQAGLSAPAPHSTKESGGIYRTKNTEPLRISYTTIEIRGSSIAGALYLNLSFFNENDSSVKIHLNGLRVLDAMGRELKFGPPPFFKHCEVFPADGEVTLSRGQRCKIEALLMTTAESISHMQKIQVLHDSIHFGDRLIPVNVPLNLTF